MSYPRFSLLVLGALVAAPAPARSQTPGYPDGYVIWQSNRKDSRGEVYRARADGTEVTRLTFAGGSMPAWAPDGRWISYMDQANAVYVMRPDASEEKLISAGGWQIGWLHDNSGLVIQEGDNFNVYDPETLETTRIFSRSEYPQFDGTTFQVNAFTQDNRYALLGSHLYIAGYTGANGSFVSEYSAMVLDLLHKDKIYFLGSGCWPFTPPLGDLVFHICANCPTHPDIYRMHLRDLDTRASYAAEVAHDDPDWGHEYNPRVSNDNKWLAYMASAGCHQGDSCDYDIWLHPLGAPPSERLRVTQDPAGDGYPQLFVGPLWQPSVAPRLLVTPNRVTFHASATALPGPKVLKLKNSGGGALAAATVVADGTPGWLDVAQDAAGITVGLRAGAAVTRGTQCVNLTITVPGAVGSPVTVPVTLIADDSFPAASALDAGVDAIAGEAGLALDAGLPDAPVAVDGSTVVVAVDAAALDCDALYPPPVADGPAAQLDGGLPPQPSGGGGGCSCTLGQRPTALSPLAVFLIGLALILRRRR